MTDSIDTTILGAARADAGARPSEVKRTAKASPRAFRDYLSLDDFERVARRRLPHMIFNYVDGTVETGASQSAAKRAYTDYSFVTRVLADVSGRDLSRTLFGKRYDVPFGISPLGGAAMVAYRGDLQLAQASTEMNVPMILSASSLIKLEDVKRGNPNVWFQGYLAGDDARITPLIDRVAAAGYDTFVVTADTPMLGNRENHLRSGFSMPMRITPRVVTQSVLHPRWFLGTIARTFIKHGVPYFENTDARRGPPMMSQNTVRNTNNRDQLAWRHIEGIRKRWKGRLVVKGILSAQDASLARELGADGIIISNHGGRQLDCAIAPLTVLPEIKAVAGDMAVIVDGGIRRGTDVLKALALGADFVFLGRPFLYAAALGGSECVKHAISILAEELDRDIAFLGRRNLTDLSADLVRYTGSRA